jgi:hypothetical protein
MGEEGTAGGVWVAKERIRALAAPAAAEGRGNMGVRRMLRAREGEGDPQGG